MSADATVARTVVKWIRLVLENLAALSPSMFVATSAGIVTATVAPGAVAFVVAIVIGILTYIAVRIAMATLLTPLMRNETVEQWSLR